MLGRLYHQVPLINRVPPWVLALGAALMLIAAGLGTGVITGQATTEIKQAITVGAARSLTPTNTLVTTSTTASAVGGDSSLQVASVSGFNKSGANDTLVIDQGADVEFRKIIDIKGRASGTLTFAANALLNEKVIIGTKVYTYVAAATVFTPSSPTFEVLVGGTAAFSRDNLVAAINGAAGAGTAYSSGTPAHPNVTAAAGTGAGITLVVTHGAGGAAGNAIETKVGTVSGSNAGNKWSNATLIDGDTPTLELDATLTSKHGFGISVAHTAYSETPGIVTENKTRFLSSLSINQGETGRIQWALENNSNQKAVARLEVTGLPPSALLTATSLVGNLITAVIRQGPTTFLVEIAENKVGAISNVELDIIAADTTPPGFYPVDVQISQIPN